MPIKSYPAICFKRHLILCILCAAIINAGQGCKKVQPGPGPGYYTSKLSGSWTVIGQECDQEYGCGDVFMIFTPRVINSMQVLGMTGDTLWYKSTNSDAHIVLFEGSVSSSKYNSKESLIYNYADNTISDSYYTSGAYSSGYYGTSGTIQSSLYTVNPEVKKYINEIAGVKSFSGIVYDTFYMRAQPDSNYSINTDISFTMTDDLTLAYDKDIFEVNKGPLHYKSIDEATQIITFETYCRRINDGEFTRLTYNYGSKKAALEQQYLGFAHYKRLLLQQ